MVVSLTVEALRVLGNCVAFLHVLLCALDSVNALSTDAANKSVRSLLSELNSLSLMDSTRTILILHEVVA